MVLNEPLLWVEALKGKYLKNGTFFLDVEVNPHSSWLWKGLMKNRNVVELRACWSITGDENIQI